MGGEVFAFEVLGQGNLQCGPVVKLPHRYRYLVKARQHSCLEPSLASDDLKGFAVRADNNGFQHAMLADTVGKCRKGGLFKAAAWLEG